MTSEYKLYCDREYLKELGQFLQMVSGSIITIFLSVIQDLFGRKKLLLYSFSLAILGFIGAYIKTTFWIRLAGLILLWSYMQAVSIGAIVLANELMVNPLRKYGMNVFAICFCVGGFCGHFVTNYIGSFEPLLLIISSFYFVGLLLLMLLLPESPSYLLKQGKVQDLKRVIVGMAKSNDLSEDQIKKTLIDLDSVIECILKAILIRRWAKQSRIHQSFLSQLFFEKKRNSQTGGNHFFRNHQFLPILYLRRSFGKTQTLYNSTEKLCRHPWKDSRASLLFFYPSFFH